MVLLEWFRAVVGLAFVLFVPGYFWSRALFVAMSSLERAVTSVALSIALVPLTMFFVSEITRLPITTTTSAGVSAVIAVAGALLWRMRRPPA